MMLGLTYGVLYECPALCSSATNVRPSGQTVIATLCLFFVDGDLWSPSPIISDEGQSGGRRAFLSQGRTSFRACPSLGSL